VTLPVRERLDNLIFVINWQLQRSTGRCAQRQASFKNSRKACRARAGSHQSAVGVALGPLLERGPKGLLKRLMGKSRGTANTRTSNPRTGAFVSEAFFGQIP